MIFRPPILNKQQSEDFCCYSNDHHLASDTITVLSADECRELLRLLAKNWPTSLAHSLAICRPNCAEQFNTVEGLLQDMLPFSE